MTEQNFPHPTVGALIFNPEGKMLLVRSHKFHDKYVVPGGHIEVGEKMTDALIREAKEETGLDVYDVEFIFFQEFIQDESFWKNMHFIFLFIPFHAHPLTSFNSFLPNYYIFHLKNVVSHPYF